MEGDGEKKWDDYLKKATVCTSSVMSGFGLTAPVLSGTTSGADIAVVDGQSDYYLPLTPKSEFGYIEVDPIPSVLITEAYQKAGSKFTMELPKVLNAKPNSSETQRLRSVPRVGGHQHRSELRSDSESRVHHITSAEHQPKKDFEGRLKRNKSTPALSSLASKDISSPKSVTPKLSPGRLKINRALRTASAHVKFLRKLRRAEKARLQRENSKQATEYVEKPLEKLRRILRSIRIIVEVCLALKRYVKQKETDEQLTLVEMQLNLQADLNKKLSFNPHYYSASYIANKGSSKLKKLLAIAPEARSKRHVKMIHALVQNKNAFSKHPANIRLKMCQVMIYQSYESRRVIIKQGHPPSAFYIILSGTCLINERVAGQKGEDMVQTINEIKEGEVFGEVALLNKTVRTASVVCKDDVELLVIYKEDFDAIVRRPIYKQREEVIEFCKDLDILEDWPVSVLGDASFAHFQYQYYRKACVVVKNNFLSNFIVFVKSGECRIVCTLDGGRCQFSTSNNTTRSSFQPKINLPLLDQPTRKRAQQPRSMSLAVNMAGFERLLPTSVESRPHRNGIFLHPDEIANPHPLVSKRKRKFQPNGIDVMELNQSNPKNDFHTKQYKILQTLAMMGNDVSRSGVTRHQKLNGIKQNKETTGNWPRVTVDGGDESHHKVITAANYARTRGIRPSVMEDTPYTVSKRGNLSPIRSLTPRDKWKIAANSVKTIAPKQTKPTKPKFAQIATLNSGCVFGLEELMKRTELRLSLVSEGAECVFISKKLFLKHAGPRTLRKVNRVIGRYPTEAYIRSQLAEQTDWTRFREEVVRDVLERRDEKDVIAIAN